MAWASVGLKGCGGRGRWRVKGQPMQRQLEMLLGAAGGRGWRVWQPVFMGKEIPFYGNAIAYFRELASARRVPLL